MSTWLSLLRIRAVVWLKDSNAFSLYHCNVTFSLLDNTMCRQTNCQIYIEVFPPLVLKTTMVLLAYYLLWLTHHPLAV
uniref:Uncharacterized protein n=1 Tax=Neolamprologus brichardi TaxID=32507 RepID=A0A3Q4HW93_NEOBR